MSLSVASTSVVLSGFAAIISSSMPRSSSSPPQAASSSFTFYTGYYLADSVALLCSSMFATSLFDVEYSCASKNFSSPLASSRTFYF